MHPAQPRFARPGGVHNKNAPRPASLPLVPLGLVVEDTAALLTVCQRLSSTVDRCLRAFRATYSASEYISRESVKELGGQDIWRLQDIMIHITWRSGGECHHEETWREHADQLTLI